MEYVVKVLVVELMIGFAYSMAAPIEPKHGGVEVWTHVASFCLTDSSSAKAACGANAEESMIAAVRIRTYFFIFIRFPASLLVLKNTLIDHESQRKFGVQHSQIDFNIIFYTGVASFD
jgi:hypothetical protein